jgi:peptidoglycan/xylan/chitin deacetylase (PgdA/CDA1 family)
MALRDTLKKRIKVLVSAHLWVGQICWRLLARLVRADTSLVILYYHSVPAALRENFAHQLSSLAGRVDVVPADCADEGTVKRRRVAITFDDGLTSVLQNALPELVKRQMPCAIFFPSGALGRTPGWETEAEHDSRDPVMDPGAVRSLPSALVAIGAHSVSHPHLTKIPRQEARREIAQSKASLEQLTGRSVSLFAFPYGDYNDDIVELCREEGIRHAYSIDPQIVDVRSRAILRGRVSVSPGDGPIEFYLKSSGGYAWLSVLYLLRGSFRAFFRKGSRKKGLIT